MKKITFLITFLTISFGYSQQLLVDFEGGAYGGTFLYSNETQGDCPQPENGVMEQKANPVSTGNPSATAVEIITDTAGNPWQNAQLFLDAGDEIDLTDPTNKTVSVLVFSASATDILAKVVDGAIDPSTAGEIATDASHPGGGWVTLNFDFTDPKDGTSTHDDTYSRILFFPLWNEGGVGFGGGPYCGTQPLQTIWIDDIINTAILGVDDLKQTSFNLFPNPTQDSWTVKTESANISSIRVFDVLGKNVLSLSPNRNEATIDGTSLNKGLYFAQIETVSGTSSLKLIKQ